LAEIGIRVERRGARRSMPAFSLMQSLQIALRK
jgi:hypothetical protein